MPDDLASNFAADFKRLTGDSPFPWQSALFDRFLSGDFPETCNLPTGLGKTSIIAIWLLALTSAATRIPRRLVYVVNRRTVVDQTTEEVNKYCRALKEHPEFAERLHALRVGSPNDGPPLAVSTLRGQFADNREWSADPSRPAVISGTVDMIGSRLLFSGYGVGFKGRPLHAGFLGQDSLIVHDEAHLEPAFQKLLVSIEKEQRQGRFPDYHPLRVIALTATSRSTAGDKPFELTAAEKNATQESPGVLGEVGQRIRAVKNLQLQPLKDLKKLAEQIVAQAISFKDSGLAVLVFVRTVEDVLKVRDALEKAKLPAITLTGTMRGKERDDLVENKTFARFLPKPLGDATPGTVYLVCTSAGEVGVNISADHLVCDLSTFESMAQRFGRVNRFGKCHDTKIHVIHPAQEDIDENNDYDQRRKKTLALLRELKGDACPAALGKLDAERRMAAFAPIPIILPTSESLFDAWALTSIKGKLPGRPEVEPYLHGLSTEWQPAETYVAWRREVSEITGDLRVEYPPENLLDECPLKPHELLRDRFDRVHKELGIIAKRRELKSWLLDDDGNVEVVELAELAEKDGKDRLKWKTVILPPEAGGLSVSGMLDGGALPPLEGSLDIADDWFLKNAKGELVRQRKRIWNEEEDPETASMHEVVSIRFPGAEIDEDSEGRLWRWLRLPNEGDRGTKKPVTWTVHVGDVERETAKIVAVLPLSDELKNALKVAATYHDHGKRRELFQYALGNRDPKVWLAKSGKKGFRVPEQYRHEFGSLFDIEQELESLKFGDYQDLVLHLIAAHHGYARPHFPSEAAFDPDRSQSEAERIASEVPRRFARLQRQYGRWGLAYLESLLRASDWAASGNPSEFYEEGK